MLPDRSGYELYASLQRDPATVAIPVLFLPVALPDIVTRLGLARAKRAGRNRCEVA